MKSSKKTAKNLFSAVIDADPNFNIEKCGNAYSMRGRIKLSLDDFVGAIEDLNKGIEKNMFDLPGPGHYDTQDPYISVLANPYKHYGKSLHKKLIT